MEVPFYEYEDEQMAYDFESAETRDFSADAYPAPGIDRELSVQYHPGVGGMDDDIPVLQEKENDKNVNNNDGKRLPRAGQVRSVFLDSWIWTETNIRYLIDPVKNMSIPLHFGFVPCLFILVDMFYFFVNNQPYKIDISDNTHLAYFKSKPSKTLKKETP